MAKPKRTDLTQERVRELFDYREDGELVWRVKHTSRTRVGEVAGCPTNNGYIITRVDGELFLNHRLVFLYHHGYYTENQVDHINRDRSDNRIENLRESSQTCNSRNMSMRSSNVSGVSGVSVVNRTNGTKRWCAALTVEMRPYMIYKGVDFTEAVAHRLAAEQCLDWPNCNSSTSAYLYMQKYLKERSNDTNRIGLTTSEVTTTHQRTEAVPS